MQDFANALQRVWDNIAEDVLGAEDDLELSSFTREDVFGMCADAPFESNCGRDHAFYKAFYNRDRSKDKELMMLAFP